VNTPLKLRTSWGMFGRQGATSVARMDQAAVPHSMAAAPESKASNPVFMAIA
jgi:hypothetical protein